MIGVKRSSEAPAVLTQGTAEDRFRSKEVIDRLMSDFHGKCYICEIAPLQSAEVEHLRPHKNGQYPERKHEWRNLFLACRHCNSVKAKPKYDEGVIDCCERDPELLLEQELVENKVCVLALDNSDREAQLTAELVEEVFMSDKPPLRGYEADMRLKELQKRMNLLYMSLGSYSANDGDVVASRTLKAMLRPEAPFAGFVRCYVRKHLHDYPDLAPYVSSGHVSLEMPHQAV